MSVDQTYLIFVCIYVIVSIALLSRVIRVRFALVACIIKFSIAFWYFTYFYYPVWYTVDDITYLEIASKLSAKELHPLYSLIDGSLIKLLLQETGGLHILYNWWNFLHVYFFGNEYRFVATSNVFVTVVQALVLIKLLHYLNVPQIHTERITLFFLLHWDILAWSSFLNIKDHLVSTLVLLCITYTIAFIRTGSFSLLFYILAFTFLLFFVRFYAIFFILAAISTALMVNRLNFVRVSVSLVLLMSFFLLINSVFNIDRFLDFLDLNGFFIGSIRFLITPWPYNIAEGYTYLCLPSIMHFVFLVFLFQGLLRAVKHNYFPWVVLICFLIISACFYGMVPNLQGPRHRIMLIPYLCIFQYLGMFNILKKYRSI